MIWQYAKVAFVGLIFGTIGVVCTVSVRHAWQDHEALHAVLDWATKIEQARQAPK